MHPDEKNREVLLVRRVSRHSRSVFLKTSASWHLAFCIFEGKNKKPSGSMESVKDWLHQQAFFSRVH